MNYAKNQTSILFVDASTPVIVCPIPKVALNAECSKKALREKGCRRRDRAMSASARKRNPDLVRCQCDFLRKFLANPSAVLSLDDITPVSELQTTIPGGGCWRGSVPTGLARKGILVHVNYIKSSRPHSNGAELKTWRLLDAGKAQAFIAEAEAYLASRAMIGGAE